MYYVATDCSVYITASGGGGVSVTTYDCSSSTMGNVMDSGLSSMTRYRLDVGEVVNFGGFIAAPVVVVVRAK